MTKILMVCLGNICRSPLAHGLLQSKLPSDTFFIDSAGTAAYHVGNSPDYRSIVVAKKHGINISMQKARQFKADDFDRFDKIYAMDASNFDNILALATTIAHREKVDLILNENPRIASKNVPDPYYGDTKDFDYVFQILDETCDLMAQRLLN